jgi:hypothetical protein
LQIKTKIVSSHTADSKPVKQEANGTVILPPLVFPAPTHPGEKMHTKLKVRMENGPGLFFFHGLFFSSYILCGTRIFDFDIEL